MPTSTPVVEPAQLAGTRTMPRFFGLPLASAVLIFGAWVSLRYTFGAWTPDADVAGLVVLHEGVSRYGLSFLASWNYTQDNWLLSLIPITSLIFTLFGSSPKLVIGIGWAIFIACVSVTSLLVYRLTDRRTTFAVAAVLLFPNFLTIGTAGSLSYPLTHNISMAWALVTLVLASRAIERTSLLCGAMAGVCVFIDAVSDPWAGPAIAIPVILVSATFAALNWRVSKGWCAGFLCVAAAFGFLAARTRLFGVLDFLPQSVFVFTDMLGLADNVRRLFGIFAVMFNIVPHASMTRSNRHSGLPARGWFVIHSTPDFLIWSFHGPQALRALCTSMGTD
jgi:hypothetical protein